MLEYKQTNWASWGVLWCSWKINIKTQCLLDEMMHLRLKNKSEYVNNKIFFLVFIRTVVVLRILLAYSPTLGLGDYMCCVHVKASKPSPPQTWSDCTIIPLTLSPTPPAMRPPFSQGCWLLTSRSAELCSAREGRTMSKFVSLPECTLDHLGDDPLAHHQFTLEGAGHAGWQILFYFFNECIYFVDFHTTVFISRWNVLKS